MQCQQCGRTLTPENIAAGVCPSCGTAIAAPPAPVTTAGVAQVGVQRAAEASSLGGETATPENLMLDVQPVLSDAPEAGAIPCPQCGRGLTAAMVAAGVCPSCGFAVSQAATPAQTATPAASAAAAPTPMPATVAPEPVPAPATPVAETPPPVVAAPPPAVQPTAPAPASVPTSPPIARVFEEPPAEPGRNVGLIIALAVVVLIIVVLALLGLTKSGPFATAAVVPTATATIVPSPTAVPTVVPPTPVAGFKAFLSPDGAFYISYPQDWAVSQQLVAATGTTVQLFSSADRANNLAVVPTGTLIPPAQYPLLLQTAVQSFNGMNPQFNPTPTTFTSGGVTWSKFTGTFDLQSVSQSAAALATTHNNTTFALVYFAPTATFSSVDTSDFQTMVTSFTFLR